MVNLKSVGFNSIGNKNQFLLRVSSYLVTNYDRFRNWQVETIKCNAQLFQKNPKPRIFEPRNEKITIC